MIQLPNSYSRHLTKTLFFLLAETVFVLCGRSKEDHFAWRAHSRTDCRRVDSWSKRTNFESSWKDGLSGLFRLPDIHATVYSHPRSYHARPTGNSRIHGRVDGIKWWCRRSCTQRSPFLSPLSKRVPVITTANECTALFPQRKPCNNKVGSPKEIYKICLWAVELNVISNSFMKIKLEKHTLETLGKIQLIPTNRARVKEKTRGEQRRCPFVASGLLLC